MDVLDPASLLQGLGVVQSLSFLEGLQRLYTAELGALGPSNGELSTQGGLSSTVFEIDDQGQRREVINLPGEDLSKIVPFRARDGQEYLLMAGNAVDTSIFFRPGEEDGNVLLFTLDYDQSRLTFDSSDAGQIGFRMG